MKIIAINGRQRMQYSNVVEPATCVSIRFGFRIAAPVVFLGRTLVRAPAPSTVALVRFPVVLDLAPRVFLRVFWFSSFN